MGAGVLGNGTRVTVVDLIASVYHGSLPILVTFGDEVWHYQ
jgi:hypothetical protein